MRINRIELAWFRGAADSISVDLNSKSMVIYGENGSGKSSFVDAIEYLVNDRKVTHLSHEYSGNHQERGLINTHTPKGKNTELRVKFQDGTKLETRIEPNGSSKRSGTAEDEMEKWEYRRTVLRQDEVAAFIHDTKGRKYSALLPLLNLQDIEVAAENLRKLAKSAEKEAKLDETTHFLKEVAIQREKSFGTLSTDQVLSRLEELHKQYITSKSTTSDPLTRCMDLEDALNEGIENCTTEQLEHFTLCQIASLDLKSQIEAVRSASSKLAAAVEPLISEKLEVLQAVRIFADKVGEEGPVKCPACGRSIPVKAFQEHIKAEQERLQDVNATFTSRKTAIGTLCGTIQSLKSSLDTKDITSWRNDLGKGPLNNCLAYLVELNPEILRTSFVENDLTDLEGKLLPLIDAAGSASKQAPADIKKLSIDKAIVEAGQAVIRAMDQELAATQARTLISFINCLEQGVRQEIRLRSLSAIDDISSDIQKMWSILHPDEAIEDVCLYLPDDFNKAIDIGLKFHGVGQESPRLTLSEGYRNSLGLCIFLAMAKREGNTERPLFLDDVVISLDRNHRGMIIELLEKDFSGRQVVILTHDREWYTELRQQLGNTHWQFRALMPYESPDIGIRWSAKTSTFDDARALLKDAPDSAGNTARKIMDIELSTRAERLKIRLPYLHREKNDRRTAHDFLSRIISEGERCFQIKSGQGHKPYAQVIETFRKADKLLLSWGNRASHSFNVVRPEAKKLIDTCEEALESLNCPNCKKPVHRLDDSNAEFVQCQCGDLRWRYGKAQKSILPNP